MKKKQGAAFLIVVILSAFILLLVGLLAILGQSDYKNQAQNLIVNKALAIAEKGMNDLINPSTTIFYDTFVATDRIVPQADTQSFCWTKAVKTASFQVDGFPDPNPELNYPPDPENYVTYDIFKVYSVGVVTKGQIGDLKTALQNGDSAVSSARVIALTVVERESLVNGITCLSFVSDTADPPEISTEYLPRKSDWQETTLTAFFAAGEGG